MKHNWEYKRLGDVCKIVNGFAFKSELFKDSGMPILRIANIQNDTITTDALVFCNPSDYKTDLSKFLVKSDDLVMALSGATTGKIGINKTNIEFYLNQRVALFKDILISRRYLFYFLKTEGKNILESAFGVAQPNVSTSKLTELYIPVPSIETQMQIVAELDKINETIEDCRELLRNLDALAQSLFYDFFGDPILNQKGWETNTIEQICISIVRGPFGGALKKEIFVPKSHNTYKVYEQKHAIQKNAQIGTYYICENDFKRLKRFELIPGDIIMSCSGTIGEFFKLPLTAEAGVMNQALLKFSLSNKVDSIYFLFLMKDMKRLFTIYGTGLQNISSVTTVKHVSIPVPPLELQKKFAERIEQIEAQKKTVEQTIAELQTLLDSRMDYWFN